MHIDKIKKIIDQASTLQNLDKYMHIGGRVNGILEGPYYYRALDDILT
jgi:hypothetical protein